MSPSKLSARDQDLLFGSQDVEPGDAVVHFEHGLAEYRGIETTTLGDTQQTLVSFMYRHGGKLLLPAKENEDFWQYGAAAKTVTLDRLKSDDWTKRRDEMVEELKQSADVIIAEDAARRAVKASRIDPPTAKMESFAEGFGYEETDDQETAINAVLSDLSSDVAMNRLLIGDVGFGKTEVALRAAAAVAFGNHQVIFIAPTTVLARQHFEDIRDRFDGMDVTIAELSRTTSDTEKDALRDDLLQGKVNIVVGTQAILTSELSFKSLGLVIIDEEQKFGEQQKTDLRNLTEGAHVLTMTATPIPRSLAAAEVGLLDVSVLATPPKERRPVETRVLNSNLDVMLDAIADERARDGQCYVVCPQVSGLEELADRLADLNPDFSFDIAHGQMTDDDIENAMGQFMEGNVDVLLSTSIIENGMNNKRANTIFLWDADRFGLAQLHQLRGRIGRGNLQAYMFLFTDIDLAEHSDAAERLNAFAKISGLGAGFRIARKDRDIRGFGKLDSDEQSGQHSHLGIGLYRHILKKHLQEKHHPE